MCQLVGDTKSQICVKKTKPIVAYRLFQVNRKGRLTSMYAHFEYSQEKDAFGNRKLLYDRPVPYPKNINWHKAKVLNMASYGVASWAGSAGFHAFKKYRETQRIWQIMQAQNKMRKYVMAKVELAGWIATHENGYRAELMRIVRVY